MHSVGEELTVPDATPTGERPAPLDPAAGREERAIGSIRVVDVSRLWAGPALTEFLGNMGAEVIKIESPRAFDMYRTSGKRLDLNQADGRPQWECSVIFNAINRNKYGVTLDLSKPAGADAFRRLVEISDLVVENYSPRVMANFGLAFDSLVEINPRIVMISLPAFGMTGPWRDFFGFAWPFEQSAGLPHFTGYEDGPPMHWGPAGADPFAAMTGAVAVLAALEHARTTGQGQFIDLSQVEAITAWLGAPMIDYSWNQRVWPRNGNRSVDAAPHGVYRSLGDDRWVAVAVTTEDEWQALCRVLDAPEWRADAELATLQGRLGRQDELDEGVERWTSRHESLAAATILQDAGVPAGPVMDGDDLSQDVHLLDRGFIEWHERKWIGDTRYTGMWAKYSRTPGTIRLPSPLFGEHNDRVFKELLGMTAAEIEGLQEQGVIGTVPGG